MVLGGFDLVRDAFEEFVTTRGGNPSLDVRKGLVTLKNLALASVNKPMLTEMGGESTVIYSMYIHYRDPQVISTGLSALCNIAVDFISRGVAQMNDQILLIAVAAMQRFSMDELVQKNACFYLKTCSYLPPNTVRMMCGKSDELFPLLLLAADNFPKLCGERANALVINIASYKKKLSRANGLFINHYSVAACV